MNHFSPDRIFQQVEDPVKMTVRYLKRYDGFSPQEYNGMSFLPNTEQEKLHGNGLLNGKNKGYGGIYGKSFW